LQLRWDVQVCYRSADHGCHLIPKYLRITGAPLPQDTCGKDLSSTDVEALNHADLSAFFDSNTFRKNNEVIKKEFQRLEETGKSAEAYQLIESLDAIQQLIDSPAAGILDSQSSQTKAYTDSLDQTFEGLTLTGGILQPVGLRNVGNSCWMNAVLQSFAAIPNIVGMFKAKKLDLALALSARHTEKTEAFMFKQRTITLLGVLMNTLNMLKPSSEGNNANVSPRIFYESLLKTMPSLSEGEEHTAHAGLLELIEAFHSATSTKTIVGSLTLPQKRPPLLPRSKARVEYNNEVFKRFQEKRGSSFVKVEENFGSYWLEKRVAGQWSRKHVKKSGRCLEDAVGNIPKKEPSDASSNFAFQTVIELSVPTQPSSKTEVDNEKMDIERLLADVSSCTVKDKIDFAGIKKQAIFQTSLYKAPNIMILSFQRNFGPGVVTAAWKRIPETLEVIEEINERTCTLRLKSFVCWKGTASHGNTNGHYWAYALKKFGKEDSWFKMNDASVEKVGSFQNLMSDSWDARETATIFFYEKEGACHHKKRS